MAREAYAWTTDDDEVALDAIIVGIGSDEKAFSAAGSEYGEILASIFWPDWISQGDKIHAALEGPYPVPTALERAEILCALWALTASSSRSRTESFGAGNGASFEKLRGLTNG